MTNETLKAAAKDITNMFRGIKPPFPLLHPDRAQRIEEAVLSILEKAENAAQDEHIQQLSEPEVPPTIPAEPVVESAPDPTLPDPTTPATEEPVAAGTPTEPSVPEAPKPAKKPAPKK